MQKKVKSADRWATQQIENAKAGSKDWLDGINNPSRDPVEAAKAAAPKWENAMKKAIADGRFKKGLDKTSTAKIQATANKLGTTVFEQGIEARQDKIRESVARRQTVAQSISDKIQSMPDATEADRDRRVLENLKAMRASKGQ